MTQLEYIRELGAHRIFEVLGLCLGHLSGREVEDLLAQELKDDHVVLAEALVGLARTDDVWNEGLPVLGPFALQNLKGR